MEQPQIHTLYNSQHCSQAPDATPMHPRCQTRTRYIRRKLDWESILSSTSKHLHQGCNYKLCFGGHGRAAALVLSATVTQRLQIHNITFLSDNQELVNFFNSGDQSTPPDCRIKHLTQILINSTRQRNTKIYKIRRTQNHIAHTLAKQAFVHSQPHPTSLSLSCSNRDHVIQCPPILEALHNVLKDHVTILTARRCSNMCMFVDKKKKTPPISREPHTDGFILI